MNICLHINNVKIFGKWKVGHIELFFSGLFRHQKNSKDEEKYGERKGGGEVNEDEIEAKIEGETGEGGGGKKQGRKKKTINKCLQATSFALFFSLSP